MSRKESRIKNSALLTSFGKRPAKTISEVVSAEEARTLRLPSRFEIDGTEKVMLLQSLGRVIASDVLAGVDVPPFDRSSVMVLRQAAVRRAQAMALAPLSTQLRSPACGGNPNLPFNRAIRRRLRPAAFYRAALASY